LKRKLVNYEITPILVMPLFNIWVVQKLDFKNYELYSLSECKFYFFFGKFETSNFIFVCVYLLTYFYLKFSIFSLSYWSGGVLKSQKSDVKISCRDLLKNVNLY